MDGKTNVQAHPTLLMRNKQCCAFAVQPRLDSDRCADTWPFMFTCFAVQPRLDSKACPQNCSGIKIEIKEDFCFLNRKGGL